MRKSSIVAVSMLSLALGCSSPTNAGLASAVSGYFAFSTELANGPMTTTGHFTGSLIFGELRGRMLFYGQAADITFDQTVFVRKR